MIYKVSVKLHRDFIKVNGDEIEVGVLSRPEDNKANLEVIEKIADHLRVSKSSVLIRRGAKSRRKLVEVL